MVSSIRSGVVYGLAMAVVAGCSRGVEDLTEANNYTFSNDLTLETVEVQSEAHLTIDWSAVTTDIRLRPFDGCPDQVAFLGCDEPQDALITRLNNNNLALDDCATPFLADIEECTASSISTKSLILGGNAFDPTQLVEEGDDFNWIASILDTPEGRDEVLMSTFVRPLDSAGNTVVALEDDSGSISVEVALDGERAQLPREPELLDWSAIETDVFGNVFDPLQADELFIGRYDAADVSEIEEVFLQVDTEAAELYRLSVFSVTKADPRLAEDSEGNLFEGFTDDRIWLVGIGCSTCLNPAPPFLTVVEPQ